MVEHQRQHYHYNEGKPDEVLVGSQRFRQFVVIWQGTAYDDISLWEICGRVEEVAMNSVAHSVDVISVTFGNGFPDFLSFAMVGDVVIVLAQIVVEHPAESIHNSDSQIGHTMLTHIFIHSLAVVVSIHSQCLLHIYIKTLEALVERLYLIFLLAVLLKYDKEDGKYAEQCEDAQVHPLAYGHFHQCYSSKR